MESKTGPRPPTEMLVWKSRNEFHPHSTPTNMGMRLHIKNDVLLLHPAPSHSPAVKLLWVSGTPPTIYMQALKVGETVAGIAVTT